MHIPKARKGQAPEKLARDEFAQRFQLRFKDPAYDGEREAIARLEAIAWSEYRDGHKAPHTREAGPEFKDPKYKLSLDWLNTRARLREAHKRFEDPDGPGRVLLICASARNDGTCPGEISKTHRLTKTAEETLTRELGFEADVLDLSLLGSEYGREIHPCKGCLSTAMPLCHWPCSCYPNRALGQVDDWMPEIYERFTRAHGVLVLTPVYWYQAPSGLKLMIDRLVCADGGNPDPTSTHGKNAEQAKEIELNGWDYPQHLNGRAYGLVVHGDVAGIEGLRRSLSDWLDWMGLVRAGPMGALDRYVGYYEPYADSHETLDKDTALFDEVRNVARAVAHAVRGLRNGSLLRPDANLRKPRPK